MSDAELKLIGDQVGGSFFLSEPNDSRHPGEILVYSSHTFPAHRITVSRVEAEKCIEGIVARIIENARAD